MKIWKYKHYKWKEYEVIWIWKHSENLEEFVIYRQLYWNYELWIRPKNMFIEKINIDWKNIQRFEYIQD